MPIQDAAEDVAQDSMQESGSTRDAIEDANCLKVIENTAAVLLSKPMRQMTQWRMPLRIVMVKLEAMPRKPQRGP